MYDTTDTIAAIATPLGESGIGVIRISGSHAYAVGDAIFRSPSGKPLAQRRDRSIQHGLVVADDGRPVDEVLMLIMKGPHSYTAEDVLEIQCHGGRKALEEILSLVLAHGARLANPGEFTQRAFVNGRIDLAQAEAVMDVIQAKSRQGLNSAVNQLEGRLSKVIGAMRHELTDFITRLEVNAGKSSLLNRLLQEDRAIVTDVPGTTRDVLEEWISLKGVPVCLVDTAGIRETDDTVEKIGVTKAKAYMDKADIILVVIDSSRPLSEEDRAILENTKERNVLIVLNKSDLTPVVAEKDLGQYGHPVLSLSAGTGEGLEALKEQLLSLALSHADTAGSALLTNTRHIELVRQSREALKRALDSIEAGMPVDCAVVDLREAWDLLGSITGDTVHDDMVEEIFSRFCLGK